MRCQFAKQKHYIRVLSLPPFMIRSMSTNFKSPLVQDSRKKQLLYFVVVTVDQKQPITMVKINSSKTNCPLTQIKCFSFSSLFFLSSNAVEKNWLLFSFDINSLLGRQYFFFLDCHIPRNRLHRAEIIDEKR